MSPESGERLTVTGTGGQQIIAAADNDRLGDASVSARQLIDNEVVDSLSEARLSVRAIESATRLGKSTVQRDLTVGPDGGPDRLSNRRIDNTQVSPERDEVLTQDASERVEQQHSAEAPKVIGADVKNYSPVQSSKPRGRPRPDAHRDAFWELRRAVEKLEWRHQEGRFQDRKSISEVAPGAGTADLSFRLTSVWRRLYRTDKELGVHRERARADVY